MIGDLSTEDIKVEEGDLQMVVSCGVIISSQLGSLLALRENLKQVFGDSLIYYTNSSQTLYLVHWNDLNETMQNRIRGRKHVRRS